MGLYNPPIISSPTSSTATPSSVAASTNAVELLVANTSRKGATILNEGTANLFIDFVAAVTTGSYLCKINPGGYFEVPFNYVGIVYGIWDVANGSAQIRELV